MVGSQEPVGLVGLGGIWGQHSPIAGAGLLSMMWGLVGFNIYRQALVYINDVFTGPVGG